ncbi:MAG: methylenetetrahydrofolate--tRNA-(uracil(54)-C(5))-methyltransferase (FADH(2)-oxidizing) TrmFO [Proteobacteria bacterium]|nr:methylenetetrahydrofolate--tRNA-(uracil(54)-C(5))-methyltransferase (FADH(2)-oxidizing) TrmFO [Pseudomonadota bacterium]MBU1709673.1 methylenetetrahydrofolate--tRNA-(uracil(54)-C(5))-methyltransferase (FADH(2)-oxidizing) TrmFO [Pseudomonadota bacterium]
MKSEIPQQNADITVIGGGLAGCEAAWQAANRNCSVIIYDMKPNKFSPAHVSPNLAELVCSNSLRSADIHSAVGLLKEEMRQLNSLIIATAEETRVPAGKALAVDREQFAESITRQIQDHPLITVVRDEITAIPQSKGPVIIATGPLTSDSLAEALAVLAGVRHLAFYDAIAPIIAADSLDYNTVYEASRYQEGPGDYLNCPMNKEQYINFIEAVRNAQKVPLKSFEEQKYFEGCLPIEVMIERGDETLRFGPLKPVGLPVPTTGEIPYAVVQLRQENREKSSYNMVGFQTKLTYAEQKRIFSMIPGMAKAEFLRLGSIHRNTFVCAPAVLDPTLKFKGANNIFLAGQLTGVEGYVESTAMGILAGINAARSVRGEDFIVPPVVTALGALVSHLTNTEVKKFQPSNVNFGLFPDFTQKIPKKLRGQYRAENALRALQQWIQENSINTGS